jgi:UDPglucose--hexose-1-phosphate uridylyltransferase
VIAPARAKRPGAKRGELEPETREELERCPFDEGREDRTPPEVFAVAASDRAPDSPGWQVRVVPNLYPAFERQEVVVHTPRHVRALADLNDDELAPIGTAWQHRLEAARAEGVAYVQLILNEGREAGASLPHNHSQLVWLPEIPPQPAAELPRLQEPDCALCRLLGESDDLVVAAESGVRMLAHPAGRTPYELLITPEAHRPEGDADLFATALSLFRNALRRLRAAEGALPINAWAHSGGHWHLEVVPRLSVLAGLELGAGVYINWLLPEEAAATLRSVGV